MYSRTCIDKIEQWLIEMGLKSINREASDRLRATARTQSGNHYRVYFHCRGTDVLFESFVFKAVSGNPARVQLFYETLLTFNGAVHPLSFGLVQVPDGGYRLILCGSQKCDLLNPHYLNEVLDLYDIAYFQYIPHIKEIAEELGLSFDGKASDLLRDLIEHILDF